ncbi:hypothetical protein C8R43DRAFT_952212 [Mycena crocata]|nr:hypothetical protein C8R43DRAFT_952212 [Mycena crocata]
MIAETTKAHQRQGKRPLPYNGQQRSAPRKFCENVYCETPVGHTKADCFSYTGGKAGKYPENFRGRKDVHLSPEARTAARRKQALEGRGGDAGNRFAGLADHTEDTEDDIERVIEKVEDGFAFMLTLAEEDDDDEIAIDEEIRVNAIVCTAGIDQDDSINHDTGASRHIFHKHELFHDYVLFESPLVVHGFGTSLTTEAVGKGKIVLKTTYDGVTRNSLITRDKYPSEGHAITVLILSRRNILQLFGGTTLQVCEGQNAEIIAVFNRFELRKLHISGVDSPTARIEYTKFNTMLQLLSEVHNGRVSERPIGLLIRPSRRPGPEPAEKCLFVLLLITTFRSRGKQIRTFTSYIGQFANFFFGILDWRREFLSERGGEGAMPNDVKRLFAVGPTTPEIIYQCFSHLKLSLSAQRMSTTHNPSTTQNHSTMLHRAAAAFMVAGDDFIMAANAEGSTGTKKMLLKSAAKAYKGSGMGYRKAARAYGRGVKAAFAHAAAGKALMAAVSAEEESEVGFAENERVFRNGTRARIATTMFVSTIFLGPSGVSLVRLNRKYARFLTDQLRLGASKFGTLMRTKVKENDMIRHNGRAESSSKCDRQKTMIVTMNCCSSDDDCCSSDDDLTMTRR